MHAYVGERTNRRHKPGRAFERTGYRFDVLGDYGAFRDLQRHRMLTIEWQTAVTPHTATTFPEPVVEAGLAARFDDAMERSAALLRRARRPIPRAGRVRGVARVPHALRHADERARGDAPVRAAQSHRKVTRATGASRRRCTRAIAEQAGHRAIAAAMRTSTTETYDLERLSAERAAEARRAARG